MGVPCSLETRRSPGGRVPGVHPSQYRWMSLVRPGMKSGSSSRWGGWSRLREPVEGRGEWMKVSFRWVEILPGLRWVKRSIRPVLQVDCPTSVTGLQGNFPPRYKEYHGVEDVHCPSGRRSHLESLLRDRCLTLPSVDPDRDGVGCVRDVRQEVRRTCTLS